MEGEMYVTTRAFKKFTLAVPFAKARKRRPFPYPRKKHCNMN